MVTPIRVDFYDLGDLQGWIYSTLSGGFRYPHVGVLVGDMYIMPSLKEPSRWKPIKAVDKIMSKYDRVSFDLMTDLDPALVALAGQGHVVSSLTWAAITELPTFLREVGFRLPSIPRTTCGSVASTVLRAANVPVTATTAKQLYEELRTASRFSGSDPLVTVEFQTNHQLKGS